MSDQADAVRTVIAKHRRHVEQSPGIGADRRQYALAVLDDLEMDLQIAGLSRDPACCEFRTDVMSARDPLAELLYSADPRTKQWPRWEELGAVPDLQSDHRVMAAAVRAFLAERVTRVKLAQAIYERIPLRPASNWSRVFTWEEYVEKCGAARELNQADAALALLRRELGGA